METLWTLAIALHAADPQEVIDIGLAPVTVLLAGTGFWSGLLGMVAMFAGGTGAEVSAAVDRGIGVGFFFAVPFAALSFVVALTA